jgi:signal transduction histidine kinase
MRNTRPGWVRSVSLRRAAPVAAVVLVSGFLFGVRPLGLANAVDNSLAGNLLLCVPFLTAYALGYEAGLAAGLAGIAVMIVALQIVNGGAFSPVPGMLTVGPWIAGRIVGSRRRLADQLRARNAELLAQQEAYAAEAVRYERSKIAADLHDIVGHALSLMVVQASAGQRAAQVRGGNAGDGGSGGVSARRALEAVAEAAREAQAEVGLLAGLLSGDQASRDQGSSPERDWDVQSGDVETASTPSAYAGLDLVAELVRQVQVAGLEVTYRVVSDGGDVDPTSAEIASRIVTEALTNALKHAPGAPVTVDVRAAGGELTVTVENGAATRANNDLARAGGGYGLTGMRDRVFAHGGRFDAGPAGDGGWRVRAVLPAEQPAPHSDSTRR